MKDNKVQALTHNTIETGGNITEHAETNAIRQASKEPGTRDLYGCAIYCSREPCPMCFGACHLTGISKVAYAANIRDGNEQGYAVLDINSLEMNRPGKDGILLKGGLLREDSMALFRLWKKINGNRAYNVPWSR